jgi:uncharacterized membrane protein
MADIADFLPPTFQILTGLTFLTILIIRFAAGQVLRPLWGKLVAFAVLAVALGHLIMSFATAKGTLSSAAQLIMVAGISYFAAAILIVAGLFIAARSAAGAQS